MKIEDNGSSFTIWLSKRDTHQWAMRSRPGSELSGRRIRAKFDTSGLRDFTINGRRPDGWLHITDDERNACLADHIEANLPKDHLCYGIACAIKHPDLTWAKLAVRSNKGDRVTEEELGTIRWDSLMGCYLMMWRGMTLGIETDGHIHS